MSADFQEESDYFNPRSSFAIPTPCDPDDDEFHGVSQWVERNPTFQDNDDGDFEPPLWLRAENYTTIQNWNAARIDLSQGWMFFHAVMFFLVSSSLLAFFFVPPAIGEEGDVFYSSLDFQFLFSSLLFTINFMTQVTFGRRENSLARIGRVKALVCQVQLGLQLWNPTRPRPSPNFDSVVHTHLVRLVAYWFRLLGLPTLPDNFGTPTDRQFRYLILKRNQQIRYEMTRIFAHLHFLLEECKECNTLMTGEPNRLADYIRKINDEMERVQMLKLYRTPQTLRDFMRIFLLVCPCFWGVHFCYLANVEAGIVFATLLALVCVTIALLLVNLVQSVEDPFVSYFFQGDCIDLKDELKDCVERLALLQRYSLTKREAKLKKKKGE